MSTILDVDLSKFPLGDGDSMPENDSHYIQMHDLRFSLELFLASHPRVHVGGNHFVYFNAHNSNDNVSPDVYVALDVERKFREQYYTFVDGKIPDLVIEIISPTNTRSELRKKHALYARLGVREYYLTDPVWTPRSLLRASLEVYHQEGMSLVAAPRMGSGGYLSGLLGLEFRVVGSWLRLIDASTGHLVPVPSEQTAARLEAEQETARAIARADQESARADQETARVADLERELHAAQAELARLRDRKSNDAT